MADEDWGGSRSEPEWLSRLACPDCRVSLRSEPGALVCPACTKSYPWDGRTARFLGADSTSELGRTEDGVAMVRGYRAPRRWLQTLRRVVTSEFSPGRDWREAKERVLDAPGLPLVIGSGVSRYERAVHLDLDDFPGVDVVGDAQRLPFLAESFSGVLCEVVLEHVARASQVVSEAHRVLEPGGLVFFVVPFVFPYHGHPGDYRRWSRQGLEQEFEAFAELEVGIHAGPCSSLVNLLSEGAYVLSGQRFPRGYVLIKGAATAVLFPLKYLDLLANRFPEAHRLAATLYVAGRKA